MLALLIETSTERGIIALLKNEKVVYSKELPYGYQNSQFLLPALEECFSQVQISAKDLSFIATGVGPGSYTGIRVAAMVAKSMAFACHLPLIGICSLETFIPKIDGPFAAMIDAKIGGVYILKGNCKQGTIIWDGPPAAYSLDLVGELLAVDYTIVTPNETRIKPLLLDLYPNQQWTWLEAAPNVSQMGKIALNKYKNEEYSLKSELELIYLRKTQAEIEKEQKQGY